MYLHTYMWVVRHHVCGAFQPREPAKRGLGVDMSDDPSVAVASESLLTPASPNHHTNINRTAIYTVIDTFCVYHCGILCERGTE